MPQNATVGAAPDTGPEPGPSLGHPFLQRTLAAFTYRDFRVLWFGAFTSTVGTWMQKVAQSWLVYDLTKSSFFLGLDDFLGQLPILLFTLVGGVIADRHDRRRLLVGSQYVQMTAAFTLAALVFFGHVRIWHILLLSFATGFAQAFGGPAYQSLVPSLVGKKDMANAIALNSIQFNLARVFGPLIATVALILGTAACFALNGLSFLVVIVALMSLHVRHIKPSDPRPILDEMRGGIDYARSHRSIIALMVLAFLTTFLGLPLVTFLPVFVREVFHGPIEQLTYMMASSGAGAVVGALVVAWLGRSKHMGIALLVVQVVFGAAVAAFAASRVYWWSCLLLFVAGAALIAVFSMTASLVQHIATDRLRGRVMSIYMLAFRGGMPLGSLAGGYLASRTSAPSVLFVNGILVSTVAIYFLIRSHGVREL
jgi:MFS family permease